MVGKMIHFLLKWSPFRGGIRSFAGGTWRIIPVSKWLITMVIVSPPTGVVGPLANGRFMAYK